MIDFQLYQSAIDDARKVMGEQAYTSYSIAFPTAVAHPLTIVFPLVSKISFVAVLLSSFWAPISMNCVSRCLPVQTPTGLNRNASDTAL